MSVQHSHNFSYVGCFSGTHVGVVSEILKLKRFISYEY